MKRASPLVDLQSLLATDRPRALAAVRKALGSKKHLQVVEAIQQVAALKLPELEPELTALFDHYEDEGDEDDKRCAAKTAVIKTLHELGLDRPALFLRAVRIHQPSFGGNDAAAPLRVASALALTEFAHPEAPEIMIDLLIDPIPDVRITAVRCLLALVPHQAYLLLRLKVALGDDSAPVIEECFTALLQTDPRKSIPFVAGFLGSREDDVRTSAAIALGESRRQAAFDVLVARWRAEFDADFKSTLLHALAMLRQDYATRFLLSLIEAGGKDANDALLALAPYRAVESIRTEVETAVAKTQAKELQELFKRKFRS